MKTLVALIADLAIAFMVWVVSDNLTSGWLVLIVVVGIIAIVSLTASVITVTAEENRGQAMVDDIRK